MPKVKIDSIFIVNCSHYTKIGNKKQLFLSIFNLKTFGISLTPAVLTVLGVCGVRIAWIAFVFPQSRTFRTIMTAYPISLGITMLLIFAALLCCRPAKRFEQKPSEIV